MNEKNFQFKPVEEDSINNTNIEGEVKVENDEKIDEEIEKGKEMLSLIFDTGETVEGRIQKLTNIVKAVLDHEEFDLDSKGIWDEIKEACKIEDKDEFVDTIVNAMRPVLLIKLERPKDFEEVRRKTFNEKGGFTPVNEIMSYGEGEPGWYHIHLAPASTLSVGEKIKYVKDGMKKFAEMAEKDEGFIGLTAASSIVARHPGIFESLGFELKGKISDEEKAEHFKDERRQVDKAIITREELINKYIK